MCFGRGTGGTGGTGDFKPFARWHLSYCVPVPPAKNVGGTGGTG
jgi:hypothetical protein